MENALENLVGDGFSVEMPDVHIGFSVTGKASVEANRVTVRRKSDSALLAEIGSMRVESRLIDAVSGNAGFDLVNVDDVSFDASVLGAESSFLLPPHLDKPLNAMGVTLARLQSNMEAQGFREFRVQNLEISGPVFGRIQEDPVIVQSLLVEPVDKGKFQLTAEIGTDFSNINLLSTYTRASSGRSIYRFGANGISLREWLHDPETDQGVIGADGLVDLAGRIRFRADHTALDPTLNLKTSEHTLRVGKDATTISRKVDLNFSLILARNQIELEQSEIEIGKLKATLVGGVKPHDDKAGYAGPLLYDIIMQHGEFAPTMEGEAVLPAAFKLAGLYDREERELQMNSIVLTTQNGAVQGTGVFGFDGETPSLKAQGHTEGISVVALKQFWPFFIAQGARQWVHDHIIGGKVASGTLKADIPSGIVFRLKQGAKMLPEHFRADLNLEDFSFRSFGDMPPIHNGAGKLVLEGMQIAADMDTGTVSEGVDEDVAVESARFVMEDFEAEEKRGSANIALAGDARSIARIANRKPLRVLERLEVSAEQFDGKAHADVAAEFPIRKDVEYGEVNWNVLLDLSNASSNRKIGGYDFADADLVIDANPQRANVTGRSRVDGMNAELRLVEPIGKSGKFSRSRVITATLDEEDRKKLDIDLGEVVSGPVTVELSQEAKSRSYKVDLTNASLSLPWIGWSKGRKIRAEASFDMKETSNRYLLENFSLQGEGFSANGRLVLSRSGLILADLKKLSLNEGDDARLKAELKNGVYEIVASGSSYDARGVMNTLIYESSFSKAQGQRSVNLTANFERITGFEKRSIYNAGLRYQARAGKMSLVDISGTDERGATYSVAARRSNNQTNFIINSDDAGNALAFTNIYSRMEGGKLVANLVRSENGPFVGPVRIRDFEVINEPRLARFASSVRSQTKAERGQVTPIIPEDVEKRARFQLAESRIEKGDGYLNIKDAIIRNPAIGITATGIVYNQKDRMDLAGTFMPANVVNSVISKIPLLGNLLSDRDNPFIGITYRLSGPRRKPTLLVNPLSIVAPGVFKKVFEFSN